MTYSFHREAAVGFQWSSFVCARLQAVGVECRATPISFAKTPEQISDYANEQDIVLPDGRCIEVKSRNIGFFDSQQTYPYETAFVDTVSGWNKKDPKPVAVVLVSQHTKSMLVVSTKTSHQWTKATKFDRVRKYSDQWYLVHRDLLLPFTILTDWLTMHQNNSRKRVTSGTSL